MPFRFLSFLSAILISTSYLWAQDSAPAAAAAAPAENWWNSTPIGLLLMLAVFFFLIIMPQSKKAKKQAQFLSSLQRGDSVITASGLYGKIYGLTDKVVTLEIAPNVRIRMDRQTIAGKDPTATAADKAELLSAGNGGN